MLPIFLIVAVDVLGLTIMIPLLPFYAEKLGATPFMVGWLIGVYAVCQLFSGPLLGRMSDHMGRKPLLIVSQLGTFIGFIITAFAPNLWILFLARAVDGSTAGNLSLAQAYISDVTKPEDRAKSFGIAIGIPFGLGFFMGPAISGFLARYDYRYPIFAAAFLSACSIFATSLLLPSVKAGAGRGEGQGGKRLSLVEWGAYAGFFRRPLLAPRLYEFAAFAFSFAWFVSGLPLFAERRFTWHGMPFGAPQLGAIWAFAGLLGIFLQGPGLGRLTARFGEKALLRAGFLSYAAGYLILALSHSIPVLILATGVTAIGGLVRPVLTSLITQATPATEQGVVLGLTQSLTSVAQITAPPIGTYLIGKEVLSGWGLITAAVAALGLALALRPSESQAEAS